MTHSIETVSSVPQLYLKLRSQGLNVELVGEYIRVVQLNSASWVSESVAVLGQTFEVHSWSADSQVPVLYFSVVLADNELERPAKVEEVKPLCDPAVRDWISIAEHPKTGLRTMFLHPCNTISWLNDTGGDWWLWIQCFGPLLGMEINK